MSKIKAIKKLNEIIKDIRIAHFTFIGTDGSIVTKPMGTQEMDKDGNLWFFTERDSQKIKDLKKNNKVNISFSHESKNNYVSIVGRAKIVDDKEKVHELWNPFLKAWFPDGLDDPKIILIKVESEKAEYWQYPGGFVSEIIGYVKAVTTGEAADDIGENKKVNL